MVFFMVVIAASAYYYLTHKTTIDRNIRDFRNEVRLMYRSIRSIIINMPGALKAIGSYPERTAAINELIKDYDKVTKEQGK
jgi:hypothetical protein